MVMVSFKIDKQLQTVSNYFLFSLAVADIAIGLVSIPVMTYYMAANSKWGLGYSMCQFWLCLDYMMCNASVLNLLLISLDRYFSFIETNQFASVGTTIAAFWLPLVIMIILYSRVYCVTKKQRKNINLLTQQRKNEKERRKNERKQESKAAKTLIFYLSFNTYMIVCWEAFYKNSIPEEFFYIAYFLCYINSTINPFCYAFCNPRFRLTYMRILTGQWKRQQSSLANRAFFSRS
ncbi:unnamed protein product [Thelazia callipaeda]|uniref:G_PROTEIN_RECEP_F1_2 domain-containing protein n=1 Tax=Thelazia callipaeda TaxID=103827 RepID=A0A158RCR7_THECL|nr:unnamed protein product [Thelazia callipaeda]